MNYQAMGAVCALMVCGTGLQAMELTGGSLAFGYSAFNDETDLNRTAIKGQAEVGFNRNLAAQLDLGSYNFGLVDETGTNFTLHGIYHLNAETSFGVFYARDDIFNGSADQIGIEAGFDVSEAFAAEVYASTGDNAGADGTMFGFDLGYDISDRVKLNAGLDHANYDLGTDLTRFSIGAEYNTGEYGNFYAEVGSLDISAFGLNGSETYVGLGFRLDFGAERGATFGQRGLLDMLPGL